MGDPIGGSGGDRIDNPLSVCAKHDNQLMARPNPLGTLLLPTAGTAVEGCRAQRDISSSEASRDLILKASTAWPLTSLLGHNRITAERDGWNSDGLGKGWGKIASDVRKTWENAQFLGSLDA